MKKINFFFLLLLGLSLTMLSACKKDKDDDGISITDGCTASWKVNGTDYNIDNLVLCVYLDDVLNLSSSTSGGDFVLQVNPITSTGTFAADVNNQDQFVTIIIQLNDGTTIGIKDGVVNVTELSNSKAKGTFSGDFFDLTDVTQTANFSVTEGEFSANF